jgi:hypothetical protein
MIKINNFITKFLHDDTDNLSTILTMLDYNEVFWEEKFITWLNAVLDYSPNLKQRIEKIDNDYYWVDTIGFNISNHYTIHEEKVDSFDTHTEELLNKPFLYNKWHFTVLNDSILNKSRIYVKIHHSYCDGYKLIDILTTPFCKYKQPVFKRSTNSIDTIYYYIVGTLLLIIIYISTIWNLYNPLVIHYKPPMKNIFCGTLNLKKIKKITKKYNITINSFLYSILVKTWYKYTQCDSVTTVTPIYMNNNSNNNTFFIFNKTYTNQTDKEMLQSTNTSFNLHKYSPFIPVIHTIINNILYYLSADYKRQLYDLLFNNIPINYSNIIGPTIDKLTNTLQNIQFTTMTKNNISFNIISFRNKINVNVSCRKSIISNVPKFIQCFKDAYKELNKELNLKN